MRAANVAPRSGIFASAIAVCQDRIQNAVIFVKARGEMTTVKHQAELAFWRGVRRREGEWLANGHYEWFYTTYFGLSRQDYAGRRVLDIGCGPRGSLEWADMARERVGLDPLADEYRALGADRHKMTYIRSGAESIPFPDGHFDIVTTFNSLDHVDNVDKTISEISRVTAPGGTCLIISDVNHDPTFTEPIFYSWDITDRFTGFDVIESRHLEKPTDSVYDSVKAGIPYDHANARKRYGLLSARLQRH